MMIFYNIFSTLAALAVLPLFTFYSLATGRKGRGLAHHFGLIPSFQTSGKKILWLYAISRGEVNAAAPILRRIREERPDIFLLVSVTTDSGFDAAQDCLPFADQIVFHPLDCWPFVALAVKRIQPDLFVVTDTGFWPGLINFLRQRQTPMILFNGRLSQKSIRRYKSVGSLFSSMFKKFDALCMQNSQSREAVIDFGVDASRVRINADPKLETLAKVAHQDRLQIRRELGILEDDLVWVAGSSHQGEENILLDAYQKLKSDYPKLRLVLAPRRLERIQGVENLITGIKLSFVRRSNIKEGDAQSKDVILLDSMGELADIYSIADITFVGRSLIAPGGGHSLLEPVAQGKIVVHGPYVENVREIAEKLEKAGVSFTVKNTREMVTVIDELLKNESRRKELSQKALAFIESEEQDSPSRPMADFILRYIDKK